MRATDPLNRTYRPKTKKIRTKSVTEKHYRKYHAEKKPFCVNAVCPHCGETIAIVIK